MHRNAKDDRRPMKIALADQPWQQLPEMATCRAAMRASMIAGLRVVELFHIHGARRLNTVNRQAAVLRLRAATEAVTLRCRLAEVLK